MPALLATTHRLYLSWAVSLLLLLAQHGALLHELSHLDHITHGSGAALQLQSGLPDNGLCPTCEAFSQLTHPASASAHTVPVSVPAVTPVPHLSWAVTAAHAPTPRSRGPPQV